MKMKLKMSALMMLMIFGLGIIEIFGGEQPIVTWGAAQHIGGRTYQEDTWHHSQFVVEAKGATTTDYVLSMVCDGHGGDMVSGAVRDRMQEVLIKQLKVKQPKAALLSAFAECEEYIVNLQKLEWTNSVPTKQPGTTVALSLLDLTNKKRYVANLGDSRTMFFSKAGDILWKTNDHTVETDKEYIESHGGSLMKSGFQMGVCIKGKEKELGGLETSRALGDTHFKTYRAEDGTVGPINPVPDVYEMNIQEDEIEIIVSDGITKHIDSPEYPDERTLQTSWADIFDENMSDDEFEKKYFIQMTEKIQSLKVVVENMAGDNERLKNAAARLIYVLIAISENSSSPDNATAIIREIGKFPNKSFLPLKETKMESSIENNSKTTAQGSTKWGAYHVGGSLFFVGIVSILCYFLYRYQA